MAFVERLVFASNIFFFSYPLQILPFGIRAVLFLLYVYQRMKKRAKGEGEFIDITFFAITLWWYWIWNL